jgi:uncharacterized protein DUF4375
MNQVVVPLAAAFLERLLFDTPPIEAMGTLSATWEPRADLELPCFGLSQAEYAAQLCLIYSGEVGNGGHSQFFMNRGGRFIRNTVDALLGAKLSELAGTLRAAVAIFPGGMVPDRSSDAERALAQFSAAELDRLSTLDTQAFECLRGVDEQLLSYLREHRNQVLVPETPLNLRVGRCAN